MSLQLVTKSSRLINGRSLAATSRLYRRIFIGQVDRASYASTRSAPFPTTASCPSPTCACAPMPDFPAGFEINQTKSLNGLMPAYAEQVLVCTGRDDWVSRIEEENDGDNLASDIKELMGRGGTYSDPFHNVSVLNSSFQASPSPGNSELKNTSVYLLPSFKYIPYLPRHSFDTVQALVKGFLLPEILHPTNADLSPIHRDRLLRRTEYQSVLRQVRDVDDVMVLICGHGGRDLRCGVLGPILRDEFEYKLTSAYFGILSEAPHVSGVKESQTLLEGTSNGSKRWNARVGLISHIGGHKVAGNIIIYIPPSFQKDNGQPHDLAGCGIWYGRVEPGSVEGIVNETILKGRVIEPLFRGGIRQGGEILRL